MVNKEEKEMEDLIESIEPTKEDYINRRINHIPFAKVIMWLVFKSNKHDFVYASELSEFLKVTHTRAYEILRGLCRAEVLYRKQVGSLVEFHFAVNGNEPVVKKYLDKAKKTLDLS